MTRPLFFSWLRPHLVGFMLLLGAGAAWAQAAPPAPHGYDFLTMLTVESSSRTFAKIIITPAIQGKNEIPLAGIEPQYPSEKNTAAIVQNATTINQTLGEVTAAGWELVQVCPLPRSSGTGLNPVATRYLFRKPRS